MKRTLLLVSVAALLVGCGAVKDTVGTLATCGAHCDAGAGQGSDHAVPDGVGSGDAAYTDAAHTDGAHDDAAVADAGGDAALADAGARATYCAGSGPPILVGNTDICAVAVAATPFHNALCSCGSLITSANLFTDSFDSSLGPYQPGGIGGSVGINGEFDSRGDTTIGGSLVVAGANGLIGGKTVAVGGEMLVAGDVGRVRTAVTVGGDAKVGGNIDVASLQVSNTLTQPAGKTLTVAGTNTEGAIAQGPVSVAPPCGCDSADLVDIDGYVQAHATNNDDADIGLDPTILDGFTNPQTLTLPCGRFYLTSINGDGGVTITATGRTALFVGNGINLQHPLTLQTQGRGEIDLFVSKSIQVSGVMHFGSAAAPARVRVYLGGSGTLGMSASSVFAGNLYAPKVVVSLAAGMELYGSMFVGTLQASAPVTIHYDRHVQQLECPQ